eukprot:scaffold240436_cov24-Tisochrysis_lutea.AAC.1
MAEGDKKTAVPSRAASICPHAHAYMEYMLGHMSSREDQDEGKTTRDEEESCAERTASMHRATSAQKDKHGIQRWRMVGQVRYCNGAMERATRKSMV